MKLMGHRTRSIFDRYAIVDESMLAEQAVELSAMRPTIGERSVVSLSGTAR